MQLLAPDVSSCFQFFGGNGWTLSCRHRHNFVSQVLALNHEDSGPTEWLPYLSVLCSPVQVVEFWGRAAKRDPPCRPDKAVWHWWKQRRKQVSEIQKILSDSDGISRREVSEIPKPSDSDGISRREVSEIPKPTELFQI